VTGIARGVALCKGCVVAAKDRLQHVGLAGLVGGGCLRCAECGMGVATYQDNGLEDAVAY
jgi:hypothetical protein